MSWDDSGNDKKKDPWSGRKKEQSPPDLDEVVRSLQNKLGSLFGGGSPKKGGSEGAGGPSSSGFVVLGVVAALIWLGSGIYIVDEGNRGVVLRFGKYHESTMPGPHWRLPAPVDTVSIVNVDQQRFVEIGYRSGRDQQAASGVKKEALMLTKDENIIDIRLAVQYRIKDAEDYVFNVRNPDLTLKDATESAIRAVIGKNKMDFVLTEGRSEVVSKVQTSLQAMLDDYGTGIIISSVNLVEAQPPEEVQGAFSDAIKAREDEQRFINEAEAYSNEVVPKARGAASRIVQEAQGYDERIRAEADGDASRFSQLLVEYNKAPEVTRKRLYLETMETVLGASNKVIMDVQGGNNLMYLPIDKLMKSNNNKPDTTATNRFINSPDSGDNGTGEFSTRGRDRDVRGR
ncbi:MAG: FtsH protease activity modulator HflK [Cycloclasticus sp.]|nr:FtsH protease activity modulator HflK [Cycloclasticus sp.]MBQ0789717.1 FtsH protease activity modulator HflK [Cycloclasticus sp.]